MCARARAHTHTHTHIKYNILFLFLYLYCNIFNYLNSLWARITFRSHANTSIFYQIILVFSQNDVYEMTYTVSKITNNDIDDGWQHHQSEISK